MPLLFEPNKKLLFKGDSITDAGRRDVAIPYGSGYVNTVRNFLIARYPTLNLAMVNRGINGNTVRDLSSRWETDAIQERPHYLSVCVGINDVWRQFSGDKATAVPLEDYQTTLRRLLKRAVDSGVGTLILMTPFVIEPNKNDPLRKMMDSYGAAVATLATEFKARFINLQAAWDNATKYTVPQVWSADKFHPNAAGAAVIAQAFLRAVGYELA
ncbi:MAG TPA: SGNH/GDSL hydrolase family protein [Aggregatilineales bacterium]|nr:SGNH/GDSL hydrolase family protein [Aggregatilineales bacterium]